jgi:hypothetical protein
LARPDSSSPDPRQTARRNFPQWRWWREKSQEIGFFLLTGRRRKGIKAAVMKIYPLNDMKICPWMALALLTLAPATFAQPPAAFTGKARVFTYEGEPMGFAVEDDAIVLNYSSSRVRVDRATLAVKSRITRAEGFREGDTNGIRRLKVYPGPGQAWLVGPGIALASPGFGPSAPTHVAVAEATVGGATWRVMHPTDALYHNPGTPYIAEDWTSWSKILQRAEATSYVERSAGGLTNRFTREQGLSGNLVAHLAVAGGVLWAGCVDVYNNELKTWADGGLCFFDEKAGRWQEAPAIENRRIRFVTGLQTIGDDLYVLHREGVGVAGDEIGYGMGVFPGDYRPVTTSIVVSRRDKDGKWTSWRRSPVELGLDMASHATSMKLVTSAQASTERAESVAVDGARLLVYSTVFAGNDGGNFAYEVRPGLVSVLDTTTGAWKVFDPAKDLTTNKITGMYGENGEILLMSTAGVYRWKNLAWQIIKTGAALKNPQISAVRCVGDEVWVGYGRQGFWDFGTQGISRYNEKTGQWSWMSPEELGTALPVGNIVCVKGDAYVLFPTNEYLGPVPARADMAGFAARRTMPGGLGRLAGGKWEFPVKTDGNPASVPGDVEYIASAGGKLLLGTQHGLFEGPAPFKQIREGFVLGMRASADGTRVTVPMASRAPRSWFGTEEDLSFWLFRYNPATGIGATEPLSKDTNPWDVWKAIPGEDSPHRKSPWGDDLFNVTITPYADWLWGGGEMIRLEHAVPAGGPGEKP